MSERWREMEASAERMKKLSDNHHLDYQERENLRRDAELLRREAKKQRDAYVNWLWGH